MGSDLQANLIHKSTDKEIIEETVYDEKYKTVPNKRLTGTAVIS